MDERQRQQFVQQLRMQNVALPVVPPEVGAPTLLHVIDKLLIALREKDGSGRSCSTPQATKAGFPQLVGIQGRRVDARVRFSNP